MLRMLKIWVFSPYKHWKYQKFSGSPFTLFPCPVFELQQDGSLLYSLDSSSCLALVLCSITLKLPGLIYLFNWVLQKCDLYLNVWAKRKKRKSVFLNFFIEDEWDAIHNGQDLVRKFNTAFAFTKREELEQLAEIFRIIGKSDLQTGVNKFLGQSMYIFI